MKHSLLIACALLAGCASAKPEKTIGVSNQSYKIDQLFVDDRGNTIYRFFDQGDWRYYVVGPGGAQMIPSTTRSAGSDGVTIGVGVGASRRLD